MTGQGREILTGRKRLVIKLGSMVLSSPEGGIDQSLINGLADEAAELVSQGYTVTIVSSGAILMGLQELGQHTTPQAMKVKQALASVGQVQLVQAYGNAFARHGIKVGQVLVTSEGLEDRNRFVNSRNTMEALHRMGVIPVINENDTVAVDEIRFGDNDFLASMVVNLADAEMLVILTNTEGLFDRDPRLGEGNLVEVVDQVDEEIVDMAGGPGESGSGGMSSKVMAAGRTARMGIPTVIADGRSPGILGRVVKGDSVGTLFLPSSEKLASRKHWIAYSGATKGALVLDPGAARAITSGKKSLLPAGVVEVRGDFGRGALVSCLDSAGDEVARGVTCFSADQIRQIMGQQSEDIENILGACPGEEVIHRDDLVLVEKD
jgi:glutamate 5-kinase